MEKLAASGGDIKKIASVASFFISRIDSAIEKIVDSRLKSSKDAKEKEQLESINGKVAIANGKLAYQSFLDIFGTDRWKALAARGAQVQRVLWASTSTKNPKYRDVLYVEELIGKDTVNTVPPATLEAFRDHGNLRESLIEDVEGAKKIMATTAKLGISIKEVTDKLTEDAVRLFKEPFDKLLEAVEKESHFEEPAKVNPQSFKIPENLQKQLEQAVSDWRGKGSVSGLWQGEAKVWTGSDESKWLGWLNITEDQIAHHADFKKLAEDVRSGGFSDILLLGMGGSSLGPEVLAETLGRSPVFLDCTCSTRLTRLR